MAYATGDDVLALYGEDTVVVAADAEDITAVEWEKFDVAFANASAEIDAYVSARYTLPIDPVPPPLKQAAIDIAVYRMCLDAPRRTDEHRKRYEDAIRLLRDIAAGKAALGLPAPAEGEPEPPGLNSVPIVL